ncbi:MAG: ABC transporter substrate-binding protein [Actinobacteria bacterium]|nr:ABC transporter substrate-binding protein [Actinomycetota bacterium]MCO5298729.1 ABC transporter substrate-binding protein [Candidatus Nanopelagicales bacterium]HPJ19818.1 ABC transporter substrate-binding protein [Actinomycetota bacterium]HPQ84360.1 ABC transporter substrate-binding protein [Actinomycetota bacterium]HRV66807.1 ABC transporter substrate-binding protein [Candidatus Nanopelagicales bacterium]
MILGRRTAKLALLAAAALVITGCSSDSGDSTDDASPGGGGGPIVVATTNFSETKILASMYQQVLQANGVEASIKELTTREVIIPALQTGEVQLTPEYLGSLTEFLNKEANGADAPQVATGDAQATYTEAQTLAEPADLTLLEPSAAQDQNAFAVTQAFADQNGLSTLSELGTYSQQSPITLGGPPECPKRPFCQPGLEETYNVDVGSFVPLDAGGPLTIQALKQDKVNVGLVFSSSGSVAANDLVVLEDDKGLQTAENILPALYTPAVTDTITTALNEVSAALTTDELQQLNSQVEIDRQSPQKVAEQWLTEQGLLS